MYFYFNPFKNGFLYFNWHGFSFLKLLAYPSAKLVSHIKYILITILTAFVDEHAMHVIIVILYSIFSNPQAALSYSGPKIRNCICFRIILSAKQKLLQNILEILKSRRFSKFWKFQQPKHRCR